MRIEQPVQISLASAGQPAATQKFAGLLVGDSILVQVLGTEGGKLILRAQDGETLRADFKGEMLFLPGDQLSLVMQSRSSKAVSFRLSSVNGQPMRMEVSESEDNLIRSGIEPTRQNLFASRILQQNGYTPSPQNLENLSRIMQANPQMPEDVAAFFAANNIEPDQGTAQMLSQIQSQPSLLGNRADTLASTLRQLFMAATESGSADTQPVLPQTVSSQSISPQHISPQSVSQQSVSQQPVSQQPVSQQPAVSKPEAGLPDSREFAAFFLQTLQKAQPQAAERIAQVPRFPEFTERLATLPPKEAQSTIDHFVASLNLSPTQKNATLAALNKAYTRYVLRPGQETKQNLPPDQPVAEDTDLLNTSKAAVSPKPAVILNAQTLQTLFQKLGDFFATVHPSDSASTAQSLQNTVHKQEKLAEDVESAVSNLAGEKHPAAQQAAEIRNQIGLNAGLENFYYYQIPVQYREQKTTAELYVFERNKGQKETRDDCTILIALDTQNMGRCETLLRADGNGLDIRLKLGSQSSCRFAEENAGKLRGSLVDSGFQIKNLSFEVLETKTTPLTAQSVFAALSSYAPGGLNIQV